MYICMNVASQLCRLVSRLSGDKRKQPLIRSGYVSALISYLCKHIQQSEATQNGKSCRESITKRECWSANSRASGTAPRTVATNEFHHRGKWEEQKKKENRNIHNTRNGINNCMERALFCFFFPVFDEGSTLQKACSASVRLTWAVAWSACHSVSPVRG